MNVFHFSVFDVRKCNSVLDVKYNIFLFYVKYDMLIDDNGDTHDTLEKV